MKSAAHALRRKQNMRLQLLRTLMMSQMSIHIFIDRE